MLAEYLLHHAKHLESLETTWAPIFTVKMCLPRFACLSLYYTARTKDKNTPPNSSSASQDGPLERNVRRLRAALRKQVLGEQPASPVGTAAHRPSAHMLTADDIVSIGQAEPFESDKTWSSWLLDRKLMQRVSQAFNSCPWALHEDMPPNHADPDDGIRRHWPSPPFSQAPMRDYIGLGDLQSDAQQPGYRSSRRHRSRRARRSGPAGQSSSRGRLGSADTWNSEECSDGPSGSHDARPAYRSGWHPSPWNEHTGFRALIGLGSYGSASEGSPDESGGPNHAGSMHRSGSAGRSAARESLGSSDDWDSEEDPSEVSSRSDHPDVQVADEGEGIHTSGPSFPYTIRDGHMVIFEDDFEGARTAWMRLPRGHSFISVIDSRCLTARIVRCELVPTRASMHPRHCFARSGGLLIQLLYRATWPVLADAITASRHAPPTSMYHMSSCHFDTDMRPMRRAV